jgi:hypothetical protein
LRNVKWYIAFLIAISISSGCSYDTLDEAIEKGIPFDAKEVIHKEILSEVAIVLYTTEPKTEEWAYVNKRMLAVAFFEKDEGGSWRNVGPNSWDYYEDEAMNVYFQEYHDYDPQGKKIKDIEIVFGEIYTPKVRVIDAASEEQRNFNKLPIIKTESGRYFFYVGKKKIVRAIAKNGEIVSERIVGAKSVNQLEPAVPNQ